MGGAAQGGAQAGERGGRQARLLLQAGAGDWGVLRGHAGAGRRTGMQPCPRPSPHTLTTILRRVPPPSLLLARWKHHPSPQPSVGRGEHATRPPRCAYAAPHRGFTPSAPCVLLRRTAGGPCAFTAPARLRPQSGCMAVRAQTNVCPTSQGSTWLTAAAGLRPT